MSDSNEMTNPATPFVRAIDAYDADDAGIQFIVGGGVTSSLVLPGSANVMGGEAIMVKHRGATTAEALIPNAPRAMKMACGENPKNIYGAKGVTPGSRMGSAWAMRQRFEAARKLMEAQVDYCLAGGNPETNDAEYPEDLSLDQLVALLQGDLLLHVHCYEVQDLEMVIRLSEEFGFSITAFHHATEAHRIAPLLAALNISAAIFADHFGFKVEGYSGSVLAPQILRAAGVNTIIKTDHPVLSARSLMHFAAKAHARGFDKQAALAAVTSNPAASMGLAGRIGSLNIGAEADFVVWDRDPFENGARVNKVYIDGNVVVDNNLLPASYQPTTTTPPLTPAAPEHCAAAATFPSYTVSNAVIYQGGIFGPVSGSVVVTNGVVSCVGSPCAPGSGPVYNLNGGTIMPGMIEVGGPLGLNEISQEPNTQDGYATGTPEQLATLSARPGLKLGGRHVSDAFKSGITVAVSPPLQTSLARGISVAFYTGVNNSARAVIPWPAENQPRHFTVGNLAKESGLLSSISGQISRLASLFGPGPNIISVDNADEILAVIEVCSSGKYRCVIFGGAEAHLVASDLASAGISVILSGARAFPNNWEKRGASDDAIIILTQAGVTVGLSSGGASPGEIDFARNLRWEAGFAVSRGLTTSQAVAAVTSTLASILGTQAFGTISVSSPANLVAFNGDPFAYQTSIQLIAVGSSITCHPTLA